MAGRKGTGAGGNNQHPPDENGVTVRTYKSKVIAEFVDGIPDEDPKANFKGKMNVYTPQEGVREALDMAFNAPGRAMVLVEYDQGPPSQRRNNAKSRVEMLNKQGYSEKSGWVVVARENKVYVLYQGEV